MAFILVGLGNPGEDYVHTRHNTGREYALMLAKHYGVKSEDWKTHKAAGAKVASSVVNGKKFTFLLPDTFMNNSGKVLKFFVKSAKAASNLIVVYDDLDLPSGTLKMAYDRGSGGHRGLMSIVNSLKTTAFMRIRVGICPVTPGGKLKKPHGEEEVIKHILGKYRDRELANTKKHLKIVAAALELLTEKGRESAINLLNSSG